MTLRSQAGDVTLAGAYRLAVLRERDDGWLVAVVATLRVSHGAARLRVPCCELLARHVPLLSRDVTLG